MVTFEADNLIYNRFDLIYQNGNVERFQYETKDEIFAIDVHYEGNRASLNIWGKEFPQEIFRQVIYDVFEKRPEIEFVDVKRAGNNFGNLLEAQNDILIRLPDTEEKLLSCISGKGRSAIRRNIRKLGEQYGELKLEIYHQEVPEDVVNQYFIWKQMSHGTDYHMRPEQYIKKYFVTDTLFLKAGETSASVLFFCQVENTAYLENLAYNHELRQFSPGFLLYEMALKELIRRGCSYFYLGGGDYGYKTRFGAEIKTVYTGTIQRQDIVNDRVERRLTRK